MSEPDTFKQRYRRWVGSFSLEPAAAAAVWRRRAGIILRAVAARTEAPPAHRESNGKERKTP